MANCLISYPNRVDEATLTGGSWEAGLPLSNLQDLQLSLVARSVDALTTSTVIKAEFAATRSFRVIAPVNHNLSESAQWRVRIGTTDGGSEVYDSGLIDCWQMAFDLGLMPWGTAGLWRHVDGDEFVGHDRAIVHVIESGWMDGTHVTINIEDTGNADGYVQIGRLFLGGGIQPAYNMSYGMAEGWVDRTEIQTTPGGAEFYKSRRPYRFVNLSLDWLSNTEFQRFYEMQRLLGVSGEVFYVPDTADADVQQRQGFLGRLQELSPIEYPYHDTRKKAFKIKELQP